MLLFLIIFVAGGALALNALTRADASPLPSIPEPRQRVAVAQPIAAPVEYTEVITHSPEFLAREAQAQAAPTARTKPGTRILFIGDSLTTSKYWKHITVPGSKLDGQGWKSQSIASVSKNAVPLLKKFAPSDVVFLAGANNVVADHPPERIERDYEAAWKAIHGSGARVWMMLLTPWAGHQKSNAARQAVTREVNTYIRSRRGQPGGPDEVIDPAELGDVNGKLRPELSGDGLHLNAKGYKALGAVAERALRGGTMQAQAIVGAMTVEMFDAVAVAGLEEFDAELESPVSVDVWSVIGAELAPGVAFTEVRGPGVYIGAGAPLWPKGWRKPSAKLLAAVVEASAEWGVPEEIIWAVIRKESNADPSLRGYRALKSSYARNQDIKIPNSGGMTWGERFAEDDWRAYGVMQVLPFNLLGVPKILKGNAPLAQMYDIKTNVRAGARVLKILYDKYGNWEDAVWKYNGSRAYQREVFAFLETFRAAQAAVA